MVMSEFNQLNNVTNQNCDLANQLLMEGMPKRVQIENINKLVKNDRKTNKSNGGFTCCQDNTFH